MMDATGIEFEVFLPDGRRDRFVADGEHLLIGSGAHCEVRLPVDLAAPEHVSVRVRNNHLLVEARASHPPSYLNESRLSRAEMALGESLQIGEVRIRIRANGRQVGQQTSGKKAKMSVVTYLLIALIAPWSILTLLRDKSVSSVPVPQDVPILWETSEVKCREIESTAALAIAEDMAYEAAAHQERRPFLVQSGVAAVRLYRESAECYRVGGDERSAVSLSRHASGLARDIEDDYRNHRVRLEHAMSVKDWDTAQSEVRVLRNLTEGRPGEYVAWLSSMDRQFRTRMGKGK